MTYAGLTLVALMTVSGLTPGVTQPPPENSPRLLLIKERPPQAVCNGILAAIQSIQGEITTIDTAMSAPGVSPSEKATLSKQREGARKRLSSTETMFNDCK